MILLTIVGYILYLGEDRFFILLIFVLLLLFCCFSYSFLFLVCNSVLVIVYLKCLVVLVFHADSYIGVLAAGLINC